MRRALGITTLLTGALAVMALIGLSCNSNDKNPMNPGGGGADKTITINGNLGANSYSPSPDTVTVGQTVAWHNADGVPHTATVLGTFDTGHIASGGTSSAIAMPNPGTFTYHCTIHGVTMSGTLVVVVP